MENDELKEPSQESTLPSTQEPQQLLPKSSEVEELNAKIVELEKNLALYKDQLLRKAADFENFKKRVEHESINLVRFANEDLLEKLLPVLDDFERSLKAMQSNNKAIDNGSIVKGIELIYNKLQKILEQYGVKPMDVVGQPFDPHLHDALQQITTNEYPPHTVVQEIEKGYLLHDKVLRHAKVIVSAELQPDFEPNQNNISEMD
jgi:molecular chaperone GrpE